MDESKFSTSLMQVANQLTEFHRKSLIFLLHEMDCGINSEKCKSVLDLFQTMREIRLITAENPVFLKRLLEIICRRDLSEMLPDSASASATVSESTILVYKIMVGLTDLEVGTLKYYYNVPQGKQINDSLDLAIYLRQNEKLNDLSKSFELIGRFDLVQRIATSSDAKQGATKPDDSFDPVPPDLELLLVGKSGVGKSRSGNTILGRKVFKSSGSMSGGPDDICSAIARVKGRRIKVVDGPGFGDPDLSRIDGIRFFRSAMRQAVILNKAGFDALLLVLRYQPRLTKEDSDTVKTLKEVFGKDFIRKFCVVIITHGDNFKRDAKEESYYSSVHEWLADQTGLSIINDCCSRVVLFDNMTSREDEKSAQLDELLDKISRLNNPSGHRYTYENLKMV